jgi:hypothetical protein
MAGEIGHWERNMDRPEPEFRARTFITGLCLDANGDLQLAAGSEVFELQLAEDERPEALRQVRVEDTDTPASDF